MNFKRCWIAEGWGWGWHWNKHVIPAIFFFFFFFVHDSTPRSFSPVFTHFISLSPLLSFSLLSNSTSPPPPTSYTSQVMSLQLRLEIIRYKPRGCYLHRNSMEAPGSREKDTGIICLNFNENFCWGRDFFKNFLSPALLLLPAPSTPSLLWLHTVGCEEKGVDTPQITLLCQRQPHVSVCSFNRNEAGKTHIPNLIHCVCVNFYDCTPSQHPRGVPTCVVSQPGLISLALPTSLFQRLLLLKDFFS